MDYRSYFTSEEWDLLRAAPFNVQVLVSQADNDRELDEIGPLLIFSCHIVEMLL